MRFISIALLAAFTLSLAADDRFLAGEKLLAAARDRCASGCVIFSREEAAQLDAAMRALILQAHALGKQEGSAACRL